MQIIRPADILLPDTDDLNAWAVIACDQFTSDPGYWAEVYKTVGDKPSTLRMMLPEAELGIKDPELESIRINETMQSYLDNGVLRSLRDSYIYLERTLSSGSVRRGIVGMLDLEYYDWKADTKLPVRATERTVEDRLPPRISVRKNAPLEMPHVLLFIDDPKNYVMDSVLKGENLYDFELMQGGGHIKGYRVADNAAIQNAFEKLKDPDELISKYGTASEPMLLAIGDGNHSIAAAKKYWNEVKEKLSAEEREDHPARFALVEVLNIHDEAIIFEPIHKVLLNTDNLDFIPAARQYFSDKLGEGKKLKLIAGDKTEELELADMTVGQLVDSAESFISGYRSTHGGRIDYIHGDDECTELSHRADSCGILLPKMEKSELFTSVLKGGPFPKKSFSIGLGPDKRYYLECRRIK